MEATIQAEARQLDRELFQILQRGEAELAVARWVFTTRSLDKLLRCSIDERLQKRCYVWIWRRHYLFDTLQLAT